MVQAEGGEDRLSQEEGVFLCNVLKVVNHLARKLCADLRTKEARLSSGSEVR